MMGQTNIASKVDCILKIVQANQAGIQENRQAVQHNTKAICNLNHKVANLGRTVTSLDQTVVKLDQKVTSLDHKFVNLDKKVTRLDHKVAKNHRIIMTLSAVVAKLKVDMDDVQERLIRLEEMVRAGFDKLDNFISILVNHETEIAALRLS